MVVPSKVFAGVLRTTTARLPAALPRGLATDWAVNRPEKAKRQIACDPAPSTRRFLTKGG